MFLSLRYLLIVVLLSFSQHGYAANPPEAIQASELFTQTVKSFDLTKPSRGTVVLFLSAHCPCSASHEPSVRELFEKFSRKGFEFVGVHSNQDEDRKCTTEHFTKSALPFPILEDAGAKLANRFGALKTPHAFVVAPNGEILYEGGVDDAHDRNTAKKFYLNDALTQISEGKSPEVKRTRTLGCMIQR